MPHHPAVLDFLLSRRSRPAKLLSTPVPGKEELEVLLTAAARTPDHGKLEPWRFLVLDNAAMIRIAGLVQNRGTALGLDTEQIEKAVTAYKNAPLAVVVVSSLKDSPKIPKIEQVYSAGAVCLALLNAALAAGWGANWLSGWASHDRAFVIDAFGLAANESVAGILHIGTAKQIPPERPRPDIDALTTWVRG